MNNHAPKRVLSGVGFYSVLAVCLVAVGVLGWFGLFHDGKTTGENTPTVSTQEEPASGEAEEVTPQAPVVQASKPAEIEKKTQVSMPEEKVDNTPVVAEAPQLTVSPLSGQVVEAFSVDQLVYSETLGDWRTHDGVDIAAAQGTAVLAAKAGTVVSVTDDALMGTTVVLSHDGGYQTTYANLQAKPAVSKGDKVTAGQIIGAVGTTSTAEAAEGPHLHFSVTKNGDVVDPKKFLKS